MEDIIPHIDPATIRHSDNSFTILTDLDFEDPMSINRPPSPQLEEVQSDSESSTDSYENIDPSDDDIQSVDSIDLEEQPVQQEVDAGVDAPATSEDDLSLSIPGMYRILDLISERGSSGLVDKIIISQDSLKALINGICPGAYSSMTKVDFKALDNRQVKPVGIYGSKEEIVRFMLSVGAIDDAVAAKLVDSENEPSVTKPTLRSGLYIIRLLDAPDAIEKMFVTYWPEELTWDDDAPSSVRRNRVTFMRYLTKICDQVTALISEEHAKSIVWSEPDNDDELAESDEDDTDRLFTFEVSKTNEQEEGVSVRPGFKCAYEHITVAEPPPESDMDPNTLQPRLLHGETRQGFMTARYLPSKRAIKNYTSKKINQFELQDVLRDESLEIEESIGSKTLNLLVRQGLDKRYPLECEDWARKLAAVKRSAKEEAAAKTQEHRDVLTQEEPQMAKMISVATVNTIFEAYPTLDRTRCFASIPDLVPEEEVRLIETFADILLIHRRIAENLTDELKKADPKSILNSDFRTLKEKILAISFLFRKLENSNQVQLLLLAESILQNPKRQSQTILTSILRELREVAPVQDNIPPKSASASAYSRDAEKLLKEAYTECSLISDADYISDLENLSRAIPIVREAVDAAKKMAQNYLGNLAEKLSKKLLKMARRIQQEDAETQLKLAVDGRSDQVIRELGVSLIQRINLSSQKGQSQHKTRIRAVAQRKDFSYGRSPTYDFTGSRETLNDPMLLFTIHLMQLTTQDQHDLQLDSNIIPAPRFKETYSFQLPLGYSVSHAQLLEGEMVLVVLVDRDGNLLPFLEHLNGIGHAISRQRGKLLHRDKIGEKFLLAFDESKRMLSVVACEKLQLHVFVHDDSRGFTASGSMINLAPFSTEGTTFLRACFICGSEELLLVDSLAIARVFSLTTMQFRPASLDLHHVPSAVYSSPDGSCFLASYSDDCGTNISAFHWSTFGSTDGIPLTTDDWAVNGDMVLTSLVRKTTVHLLKLDLSAHMLHSLALNITRKVTEFMFKEKDGRGTLSRDASLTAHNCLMDCHAEVWTRFPVLPAVQRATISSSGRCRRSLRFVANRDHHRYPAHFTEMVEAFERTSKKPTGDKLSALIVSATTFDEFRADFSPEKEWTTSLFRYGEWIVDILCLIPIHLALARDNRFIPLKNGVYSPDVERSLLGADINRIVDSISFGWYESLFQSYMADKPVRVVSSMGEQSVGKSFALNHFVDTSFAGSAMRTTEGVWMSVTPTKEALLVALDFEGVHSIERSAQEDTLLVLFNTAISNLVLFRNNFALSRDITGLFQSFQSSSTVLDPVANPGLFQSTLVIIIKDVVDSDKAEIAREFSLKFQQIVEEEQDANFISRLHGGKLNIIPWPVIESKDFYKLFPTLKRRLDQQLVTHKAAGEFLHLMKTLMAKLKANDWGALAQTMASHRAQLLLTMLPIALAFGLQDVEPDVEPLKNLDTDNPVDLPDTGACFFVAAAGHLQRGNREEVLKTLLAGWDDFDSRQLIPEAQWVQELSEFLDDLVDMRINHVRAWVSSNLTRFQAGHASVMELHRTLESAVIDLKGSVQLCRMRCASCQLLCIQKRLHDGPHDCQTEHACTQICEFCAELETSEEEEVKRCTMIAGHSGKHVCAVTLHLCGAPCKLLGKSGCLEECSRVSGHEDEEHHCAASVHACGEPCDLSLATLADGSQYTCTGRCRISSDIEHDNHQCDAQYCPIPCQLCKRLCMSPNHLHALESGANHLCGQEHPCSQRCTAPGVCAIDTAPQSIQATFNGMHECFQYTKVIRNPYPHGTLVSVAKRLKCVKSIPPGHLKHEGSHAHSLDSAVFHYCEERCVSCEYFCTLPLGHSQQEHETSHGSMSNVRWAVDGPDEEGLVVEGRRFSTNDEGAPMMCNLVCQALGRHVHIDYCRAEDAFVCRGNPEIQHSARKIQPEPDRSKDFLTHGLFWKRSGFKDPYSREDQANFAKCDSMCSGPEHFATPGKPAQPSYCTLPLFHPPMNQGATQSKQGYVSNDGHHFTCRNPAVMQQAFHVIFLIDKSASMRESDRRPLSTSAVHRKIVRAHLDNRLGAVVAALYSFWTARVAAADQSHSAHRDSYSIVMHEQDTEIVCENDLTSSPDQLLDMLLTQYPQRGNSFSKAIKKAQEIMERRWSTARPPVVVFLSDGIGAVPDSAIRRLFSSAMKLGGGLSLHAILFGPSAETHCLRRMIEVAFDEQNKTPSIPAVASEFHEALESVQLAQAFLGIADSLKKPRGALMQ
ncbi:hypothetical protein HYDPIDRAFT_115585 [Hydnomerulius pinastri MD-312]|uniref:VWFA domain-containing protein n=1 Tax=Hydnomerulius pinastri MD-312 TaxID=994086 RepID=A0A0C9WC47_9AGAM|nr:hypothetical protein HYDPIDRAFT_115585 [Hydnomerulius pinastri MD-312]